MIMYLLHVIVAICIIACMSWGVYLVVGVRKSVKEYERYHEEHKARLEKKYGKEWVRDALQEPASKRKE